MAPKAGPSKEKSVVNAPEGWRRSESPEEAWEDGEWPVSVVGEEVDYWGDVRHELEWGLWERKDGTNNTWKDTYVDEKNVLNQWNRRQGFRRKKLKEESLDIELSPSPSLSMGLDIHNNDTYLRAQAFKEKLDESKRRPCMWAEDRLKLISAREYGVFGDQEGGRGSRRLRSASARPPSQRASSTLAPTNSSSSVSRASSNSQAPTPRQHPPHRILTPASSSVTLNSESPRSRSSLSHASFSHASVAFSQEIPVFDGFEPQGISAKAKGKQRSPPPTVISLREKLGAEWSQCAPVTFYNNVDEEEIPPLPANFKYIERGYVFDPATPNQGDMSAYLLACSGHKTCSLDLDDCDCQKLDEREDSHCAYDKQGLFLFNVAQGEEVLECTPLCECGINCRNRVVQRDRDVPLEIFKTKDRGWGVRAKVALKRGKVLGMYTGLLLPRQKAVENKTDYCFDLDGGELLSYDEREGDDGYSVDSSSVGNWSRFINHSCDGNLKVYEVVYDLPPGTNMPYIAYAALRDIPAGVELTFDYMPKHGEEFEKRTTKYRKGGSGKRIPAGSTECRCGTSKCRGYI